MLGTVQWVWGGLSSLSPITHLGKVSSFLAQVACLVECEAFAFDRPDGSWGVLGRSSHWHAFWIAEIDSGVHLALLMAAS